MTFEEIYTKYNNLVFHIACEYSGNRTVAEDIRQETFLTLYISINTMDQTKIHNWLYTAAKNAALNFNKKQERIVSDTDNVEMSEEIACPSLEEVYLEKERDKERQYLLSEIMAAMQDKNPRWHQAISTVYMMKVPQAQAAKEMGISLNVLVSLLHRAREWVKKEYGVVFKEMNQ